MKQLQVFLFIVVGILVMLLWLLPLSDEGKSIGGFTVAGLMIAEFLLILWEIVGWICGGTDGKG